jgi:hypothetical protein
VTLCPPLLGATCSPQREIGVKRMKMEWEKRTMFSLAFICARTSPPVVCRCVYEGRWTRSIQISALHLGFGTVVCLCFENSVASLLFPALLVHRSGPQFFLPEDFCALCERKQWQLYSSGARQGQAAARSNASTTAALFPYRRKLW